MPQFKQISSKCHKSSRGDRLGAIACFLTIACLLFSTGPAESETLRREPGRYALVIGNGSYNNFSAMGDLRTACDEAVQFRRQLVDLGWARDHIYPQVRASGASETDADIRTAICDLKTDQLQGALKRFSNLIIDADDHPLGLVYYSGHGAQSNGSQYVFGVDANVDFGEELRRAQRAPSYRVFEDSGVDIIQMVGRVSLSEGRAMLVIIDACRDNPVLNRYREDVQRAKTGNLDQQLVDNLSAGYMAKDRFSDERTANFNNIMVLFSTQPTQEAAGASPGQTTSFFQFVMDQMHDSAVVRGNVPGFVAGVQSEARIKQAGLPISKRQLTEQLGAMAASPVFCLKGCPQPIDAWPSVKVNIITGPATSLRVAPVDIRVAEAPLGLAPFRHMAAFARPDQPAPPFAAPAVLRIQPAAFRIDEARPPSSLLRRVSKFTLPNQSDAPAPTTTLGPPRSIKVDVFYCQGDSLAAKREADATAYARSLYAAFPPSRLIGRYYIDPVRTVSFDPVAKPVIATGKFGNTIWIDAASPLEHEWADRFAGLGTDLRIIENRWTKTKEYISVFFCQDRAENAAPVSTVYTQVSRQADVNRATALIAGLKAEMKGEVGSVNFNATVEPVDEKDPSRTRVPTSSEVRYYQDDQRTSAQAIANALTSRLTFPIRIKKVVQGKRSDNPVIEVWIGLIETRSWTKAGV